MGCRLENSDVMIVAKLDRPERNAIDARKTVERWQQWMAAVVFNTAACLICH